MLIYPLFIKAIKTLYSPRQFIFLVLKRPPRLSLVLLVLFTLNPAQSSAQNTELLDPQTLIKNLRQGGYVLYMRHAASDRSQTDTNTDDLSNCATQRNLSAEGRLQAEAIGKAIKSHNIPIGTVTTSPYCRCVDTAKLAFGGGVKSDNLRFTISTDAAETQRLSNELQKLLATQPAAGRNSVIVAHTGNLQEAAKVWPKPEGVIHVFKPLGEKNFKHLGRITPKQWQ